MIKVCVVNPNYYRSSGVTTAIRRIYENLPAGEVAQYFVDCNYGDERPDISWIPQDRLATFDLMAGNPATLMQALTRFLRWLRMHDIHIVHVHHRRLAAILGRFQRFRGYQVIYTGQLTYRYVWWFWLLCPGITTGISKSVVENIKNTTRATQIHLISNGCDFPANCPQVDAGAVNTTAICIARLEPVKGHDNLLEAWRILLDRGHAFRLILVGEGSLRETLGRQAKRLRIDHLVEFRGFHADVTAQIDQALFAVLASRVEGQGIVTIEAASRGRASLVTDVDGSRDCVPPGHVLPNLVKLGNVAELADALQAWFAQPDAAVVEGGMFFDFLRRSSSSAIVAQKYRALYEQVGQR